MSGVDAEREHALAAFKNKLLESREWESKLKALRQDIKGLQKEYDHTEDNIKALQSVGQIIGEVLKQLDDERCEFDIAIANISDVYSYCQSIIRSEICGWMQVEGGQGEAQARNACGTRYDDTHDNAHAATGSRPVGVQYVAGRSWTS